ncbi:MAG: ABC transporter ATP-binding protein [Armatimonadetes bacterium]|nr:ABC transporter ATP-binding protein [Armatimonadota bacterium]
MALVAILEVRDLEVSFGPVKILRGVSFDLNAGETLGVVGESGCGKSMTGFALMGMIQAPGRVTGGSIKLEGKELVGLSERDYREIRGSEIALVMQDPFTSLNPMMRVGDQIAEAIQLHQPLNKQQARQRAIEMIGEVGVPSPESSARKYPHQLSGGQRQRIVIAIAFACRPKVLIADEPTTALDVTLQAQILRLLRDLEEKDKTAIMFISHDIGAIGAISHRVAVFYAGEIVEVGNTADVLRHPAMPYTKALLGALPSVGATRLESISGQPPLFSNMPEGCKFAPRCEYRVDKCDQEPHLLPLDPTRQAACWRKEEILQLSETVGTKHE